MMKKIAPMRQIKSALFQALTSKFGCVSSVENGGGAPKLGFIEGVGYDYVIDDANTGVISVFETLNGNDVAAFELKEICQPEKDDIEVILEVLGGDATFRSVLQKTDRHLIASIAAACRPHYFSLMKAIKS
jgi:hypothetical protein